MERIRATGSSIFGTITGTILDVGLQRSARVVDRYKICVVR
jgi:hypothetical protein